MRNSFEVRGEEIVIFLTRRNGEILEAFIDAADLKAVDKMPATWCAHRAPTAHTFYVRGSGGLLGEDPFCRKFLHKYLFDFPSLFVDHINGNGLDNRRSNLRLATKSQNMQNQHGVRKNSTTRRRGVSFDKKLNKYRAYLDINKRRVHLGLFDSLEEADKMATKARVEMMPFSLDAFRDLKCNV